MKRSKMVEILKDAINEGQYQDYCIDDYEASRILKVLEDAGMVPPIIEHESWRLLSNGEMTYAAHYWESEDE